MPRMHSGRRKPQDVPCLWRQKKAVIADMSGLLARSAEGGVSHMRRQNDQDVGSWVQILCIKGKTD